jgi:predicted Zn-dependent protease
MGKRWAGLVFLSSGLLLLGAKPVEVRAREKTAPTQNAAAEKPNPGASPRDPSRGKWNFWSPERELALGRDLAQELESSARMLDDPLVNSYVTELTERIARHAELHMPVMVRVLDSAEVDSFSLPGGFLYVTTGLIRETRSEAELAAVIAHEVAHVAARHATRQMTRARLMNWATLPLLFVGGPVALALREGAVLALPLTYLKFSRNDEREADSLGLGYLEASGYDPMACVEFFERLRPRGKEKHRGITGVFSTHPMTSDRIAAAERIIQRMPEREEYVLGTSRHDEIRVHLDGALSLREIDSSQPVLRRRTAATLPAGPFN